MQMFGRIFDNTRSDSLATYMRRRRFALFESLLNRLPRPVRVLDVGGSSEFWERMGYEDATGLHVVLLNLRVEPATYPNFSSLVGDARAMTMFADRQFDVVFSNSVIEHLGSYEGQQLMAAEIQRVGKRYFVQTPNRMFPIEPHFLFPWFQYLPQSLQVAMVRRFNMGWHKREPDLDKAIALVAEHRLLTLREMSALFPKAQIYRERVLGLTKSFVAYSGWD